MTKSLFEAHNFEDETDSRFPRARVLVVGKQTSLASALVKMPASGGQQLVTLDDNVNLSDDREVFEAIRMRKPNFVVNCLVENDVDRTEQDSSACRQINHDLPVNLAIACREFDSTLIQLSTDYIFDGQKDIAYFEDDAPNPLNRYGQTMLDSERDIVSLLDQYIILRVAHLFSATQYSFISEILEQARTESTIQMVEDETGCPTSVRDIARIISAMIDQLHSGSVAYGIFHAGCQGDASWAALGECVIAQARQFEDLAVKEVIGISGKSIQGRAVRPKRLVLSTRKLLFDYGIKPRSWRQELAATVERYYKLKGKLRASI